MLNFFNEKLDPSILNQKNFVAAEKLLLGALIQDFNPKTSSLLPFPIFAFGQLIGAAFFVYDQSQVRPGIQGPLI